MVKKNDGDLGKQRLFGVIGQAVFVEFLSFHYYRIIFTKIVQMLK